MTWKQATDACAGTAAKYGAPDVKKINQLLSDTNVTDTVKIHESVAWTFQADSCTGASVKISNPAQTFNYTVVASAIAANRNLTIPLLTGTDTMAVLGLPQSFTLPQTFSCDIKVAATKKVYLDGGTNTYINERVADTIAFVQNCVSVDLNTVTPIGTQDKWIGASEMWARVTTPAGGLTKVETPTNRINYQVWEFDTTVQEFIQFSWVPPRNFNNSTIKATFWWTNAAGTAAQTVDWGIQAVAISNDDPLEVAMGTQIVTTDTWIALNDVHISPQSTAITIAGTPADSDFIMFQIARNVATDNMTGDARLLGIVLEYSTDKGTVT